MNFFGIDWKKKHWVNYITIDSYDVILNGKKVDVKTETVPRYRANKIINHMITDDEPYGRRLFCKSQEFLLAKYDVVVFGLVIRDEMNAWYPIGYIDASRINMIIKQQHAALTVLDILLQGFRLKHQILSLFQIFFKN